MTRKLGVDQEETVVDPEDIEGVSEDITELQASLDDEINAIISEFGGDPLDNTWKIHVKRIVPNQGTLEHCFSCTAAELPILDRIKNEYGPGAYQLYVFNGNKLRKKPTITIASPLKKSVEDIAKQSTGDLSMLVATMMDRQDKQMELVQNMMRSTAQPAVLPAPVDPVGMMTAMMGAMVQMKEFMQPAQSGDNMAMFVKGIEIAKDFAGGGAETNFNDTVIKLGKELLPSIISIAQSEQQGKVNTQLQRPIQPTQPAQAGQPRPQLSGAQPVNEPTDQNAAAFKMQIDMLVAQAAAGKDAGIYADLIADNVPAEQIQEFITRSDMVEYLAQFNPQVPQYRQWFENLRSDLQEILTVDTLDPDKDAPKEDLTDDSEGVIYPENNEIESEVETVIEPDATTLDSELTQNP